MFGHNPEHMDLAREDLLKFTSRLPSKSLHSFWRLWTRSEQTGNRVEQKALENFMWVVINAEGRGRKEMIDAMGAVRNRRVMGADGFLDAPPGDWDEEEWEEEEEDNEGMGKKIKKGLRLD